MKRIIKGATIFEEISYQMTLPKFFKDTDKLPKRKNRFSEKYKLLYKYRTNKSFEFILEFSEKENEFFYRLTGDIRKGKRETIGSLICNDVNEFYCEINKIIESILERDS